jgi:hypothetical protein
MPHIESREAETTAILLELLTRAATAHGVHEEQDLGGVYDTEWPLWYAHHMTRELAASGYRIIPTEPADRARAHPPAPGAN